MVSHFQDATIATASQDLFQIDIQLLESPALKALKIAQCYRRGVMPPDVLQFINSDTSLLYDVGSNLRSDIMNAYGQYATDMTALVGFMFPFENDVLRLFVEK